MSSANVDETDIPDGSINPVNVRQELVAYLTTSIRYVYRQGLAEEDIKQTVDDAIAVARPKVVVVPELLDKGVNDMRDRIT